MNDHDYERAGEEGRAARRSGRKREANPYRGVGEESAWLHEAWEEGWEEEDAERQRATG